MKEKTGKIQMKWNLVNPLPNVSENFWVVSKRAETNCQPELKSATNSSKIAVAQSSLFQTCERKDTQFAAPQKLLATTTTTKKVSSFWAFDVIKEKLNCLSPFGSSIWSFFLREGYDIKRKQQVFLIIFIHSFAWQTLFFSLFRMARQWSWSESQTDSISETPIKIIEFCFCSMSIAFFNHVFCWIESKKQSQSTKSYAQYFLEKSRKIRMRHFCGIFQQDLGRENCRSKCQCDLQLWYL